MPEGSHWKVDHDPIQLRRGRAATMKVQSVSIIHSKAGMSREAVARHWKPGLEEARALAFAWDYGWVCTGFLKREGVAPRKKEAAEWHALVVGTTFEEESRVPVEVFGRRWMYYDWKGIALCAETNFPGQFPEQLGQFQEQAGSSTSRGRL